MGCLLEDEMKKIWHNKKTLGLLKKIINEYTKPNSVVVDGFSGLGTIPVLAAKMGRRAVAVEVSFCYIKKTMYYRWKGRVEENMIIIPNSFFNKDIQPRSVDAVITAPPTVYGSDTYSKSRYAWENNTKGRESSAKLMLKEASRILKPNGVLIVFIAPFDEPFYEKEIQNFSKEAHYVVIEEMDILKGKNTIAPMTKSV